MPVALKRAEIVVRAEPVPFPVWKQLLAFAAAGLFVSVLAMTYGVDLSPGFF